MAALLAQSFTTCHTTRYVTPVPQVLPARQTHRNTRPSLTPADTSQVSMALLTQSGTGTVRNMAPLANQVNDRLPLSVSGSGTCQSAFAWSAVSQLPRRTPR